VGEAGRRAVARAERRVDHADTRRALLDPARTLARGWSITRTGDGRVVRSIVDVVDGADLETLVGDGTIASRVTAQRGDAGRPFP
jgi:exonuclease VII large subunit